MGERRTLLFGERQPNVECRATTYFLLTKLTRPALGDRYGAEIIMHTGEFPTPFRVKMSCLTASSTDSNYEDEDLFWTG
jgi:hypothetical protein